MSEDGAVSGRGAASERDAYDEELPPIVLHLTPWDVFRAAEALREGRGMIAGWVADKLEAAAPEHMARLDGLDRGVKRAPTITEPTP